MYPQQYKKIIITCKNWDESQRHYVEWQKSTLKGYIFCHSTCMTFSKRLCHKIGDRTQSGGFRGFEVGLGSHFTGDAWEAFWGLDDTLWFSDCGGGSTNPQTYTRVAFMHHTPPKHVDFTVFSFQNKILKTVINTRHLLTYVKKNENVITREMEERGKQHTSRRGKLLKQVKNKWEKSSPLNTADWKINSFKDKTTAIL